MYSYGKRSKYHIDTLHVDLQTILYEVIKEYDISVIEGHRTIERQQELFNSNPPRTKIDGINILGKHNHLPSLAVDIVPHKKGVDPFEGSTKNLARFYYMMGIVRSVTNRLLRERKITHDVRFGLDWNKNGIFTDQKFHDLPHIELIMPEIVFGSSKN